MIQFDCIILSTCVYWGPRSDRCKTAHLNNVIWLLVIINENIGRNSQGICYSATYYRLTGIDYGRACEWVYLCIDVLCACVRACLCVCVWEREREGGGGSYSPSSFFIIVSSKLLPIVTSVYSYCSQACKSPWFWFICCYEIATISRDVRSLGAHWDKTTSVPKEQTTFCAA